MVMLQAFNGAGDTVTPTIVNFFGFWVLEIPLAWWLSLPQGLHSTGVFLSIVIAQAAVAATGILLFRRGKWKRQLI
jgi:Na+-driven multidrug efflux pump